MTTQLILPFDRFTVPPQHVQWLHEANAGDYWEKKRWFYPFKTRFCYAHGVRDGHDLQTITKKCYCGDGIWRGVEDMAHPDHWDTCRRCSGTGIYLTKHIVLARWLVGGVLFHEPTSWLHNEELFQYRERIEGRITHAEHGITAQQGRRAMERLLLRYEWRTYLALWQHRWRNHTWRIKAGLKMHIARVKRCLNLTLPPEEIPF